MKHCPACKSATGDKWKYYHRKKGMDGLLHAIVSDKKFVSVNLCVYNSIDAIAKAEGK